MPQKRKKQSNSSALLPTAVNRQQRCRWGLKRAAIISKKSLVIISTPQYITISINYRRVIFAGRFLKNRSCLMHHYSTKYASSTRGSITYYKWTLIKSSILGIANPTYYEAQIFKQQEVDIQKSWKSYCAVTDCKPHPFLYMIIFKTNRNSLPWT